MFSIQEKVLDRQMRKKYFVKSFKTDNMTLYICILFFAIFLHILTSDELLKFFNFHILIAFDRKISGEC